MNENQNNESVFHINYKDFLFEALRYKYIIILILAVSILVSYVYTAFFCRPLYSACSKILILNSDTNSFGTSEYSISTYLTKDFLVIITEREVLEDVIKNLELDMSYESLKGCITANNPQNTRILEINVTTPKPKLSQDVANEICEVSRTKIVDLMGVDRVNIFSRASKPTKPSSPDMKKNLTNGFFVGTIISFLFLLFVYFKNDKINGSEDVRKHLGLCTLATIPYNQSKAQKKDIVRRTVKK